MRGVGLLAQLYDVCTNPMKLGFGQLHIAYEPMQMLYRAGQQLPKALVRRARCFAEHGLSHVVQVLDYHVLSPLLSRANMAVYYFGLSSQFRRGPRHPEPPCPSRRIFRNSGAAPTHIWSSRSRPSPINPYRFCMSYRTA